MRLHVTIRTLNGLAAEGEIRDISSSGALVSSALPVPLNTTVLVRLDRLSGRSNGGRAVAAEIVRHVPGGFALEWAEFACEPVLKVLRHFAVAETPSQPEQGWRQNARITG